MLENFMPNEEQLALETILECFELECAMEAVKQCREAEMLTEGTNIDTLKEFFGDNISEAKKIIKQANNNYSGGNYKEAKEKYEKGMKLVEKSKDKITSLPNNVGSTVLSVIIPYIDLVNLIVVASGTITTRKPTSHKDFQDATDETMSWNTIKASAVASLIRLIKWCKVRIKQCEYEIKNK